MPKNKRPVPRKTSSNDDKDEVKAQALADLALDLVEQENDGDDGGGQLSAALRQKEEEFHRLVRKLLHQKNDEVLYDAIERARFADVDTYCWLRGHIEEASGMALIRRDGAPVMEVNAFVVPLFAHSRGGLKQGDAFQDQDAFDALVASFQQAQLESARAKVVLVAHAYDLNEIDAITFSHLSEMVREAGASMMDKKISAAPSLERSILGWSGTSFAAADSAVELRFLLGFALKRADDPFYQPPEGEAQADAWFDARMLRFQQWTQAAAPLLQRCLAARPDGLSINFLYQDLFYGGKEQGMAEYFMLQMMADINHALREHKTDASQVRAIVGPADVDGAMVLRVNLYGMTGEAALASSDKPLDLAADLQVEVDDVCDALATIGIASVAVAQCFDAQGQALEAVVYRAG